MHKQTTPLPFQPVVCACTNRNVFVMTALCVFKNSEVGLGRLWWMFRKKNYQELSGTLEWMSEWMNKDINRKIWTYFNNYQHSFWLSWLETQETQLLLYNSITFDAEDLIIRPDEFCERWGSTAALVLHWLCQLHLMWVLETTGFEHSSRCFLRM